MLNPPEGIRPVYEALDLNVDMCRLRHVLDDYLADLRVILERDYNQMDDPLTYILSRDYLNAVEQMRDLLGNTTDDEGGKGETANTSPGEPALIETAG